MQKKLVYLILITSTAIGLLAAIQYSYLFVVNSAFNLSYIFFVLIACIFSYLYIYRLINCIDSKLLAFKKSDFGTDKSGYYDINLSSLGQIARNALRIANADYLEISVKHSREQSQIFSFCTFISVESKEGQSQVRKISFKIATEYVADLHIRSKEKYGNQTALMNQLSAQFAYILNEIIFSQKNSRFVELAEQTLRAKTGFLANLSHEVRAPLGVILNATELVLDGLCGQINDNQKKFLSLSKKSSDHLLDLINDVLDFAKIEAGKINPQPKTVSVAETLKDILNMLRLLAESKKIEIISHDIPPDLYVSVDKKHFRQILINLATNAVKYTQDNGQVEILVDKLGADYVKISLKDSGVGIPKEQRYKVFKPFERLEDEYSKKQSGVGIGLSLAKKLAELNSGKLDFESEPGKGSTFFLTIPVSNENLSAQSISVDKKIIQARGETIVVIEPDIAQSEIVVTYLRDLGYNVLAFEAISDAEEILRSRSFDLLILDNNIFDEKLDSLSSIFRSDKEKIDVPVILLSSRAFIFDLEKYLKAGVERCLPKPAPLKELATLCKEILSRNSAVH